MTQISSDIGESLFAGDGEMCTLMRSHDWSQTPLGAVEQWPQSLRTTVSILLNSRYPMFTFWGSQLVKLYNDAYRPVLGSTKHPQALGMPANEVWPEIWDAIGPLVEQVVTKGESTWFDNFQLFMHRSGYLEETYFTFSYSPIRDETGGIGGLFCACTETTKQVLSDRRLRTLRDLAAQTGKAKTVKTACEIAIKTLGNNAADIPFALLYLLDAEGKQAELVGATGLVANTPASPSLIDLMDLTTSPWPLAEVVNTADVQQVTDLTARFGELPVGVWQESPHTALVLPVASPGQEQPTALLVVGISSRRVLDDDYQGFLELVAGQVVSAIADARAYEAELKKAEALAEIDRAKTVFFSNVSHEFRTPLTLMLAPLEDALADTSPHCQQHNAIASKLSSATAYAC
ncbi:GAF domain-containing protein [Fortiea sp. LEGE XX443]|uniref:GAF domain-containing protein n=1 Tax=Fortiea sp. LEGE XX443 TaxID=1828611 RepID=UPI001D135EA3|nr:GAF domain-containing protein [Fortiea sp. LEGE XX443]